MFHYEKYSDQVVPGKNHDQDVFTLSMIETISRGSIRVQSSLILNI